MSWCRRRAARRRLTVRLGRRCAGGDIAQQSGGAAWTSTCRRQQTVGWRLAARLDGRRAGGDVLLGGV
jgi:hypothetical protein